MPPTVLVLDSNTTVQRMTKLTFKAEGVRVNAVHAGSDPFEQIEKQRPDIIFTDDAGKVAAFLKSRPNLPRIPLVLLKGAFDASDAAHDALADAVLMKPLQPDAMIQCVRRLLSERKSHAPISPGHAADDVDRNLDLEQYFDQLSAAFERAQSTPPSAQGPPEWSWGDARQTTPRHATAASEPRAAVPPERPDRQTPPSPPLDRELVEQVTQRVLDRLGERIVRSTATEIVSRLSKWLIVNEVERSKAGQ